MFAFDFSKRSRFSLLGCAVLLAGALTSMPPNRAAAQNMSNMGNMPASQAKASVSGTGTVMAVDTSARKIKLDHGPLPAINWPAMKMEFAVAPSVDLSKVKPGDKVTFTLSGSNNSYTVRSIAPAK